MISVALCTYNGEKYIEKQLESIIAQTIPINEIIICDDGSSDNTINIIHGTVKKYPNIVSKIIVNKDRLGVRRNFEKALNICNGNIKILSDQDDIWFPKKVEFIIKFFKDNPQKDVIVSNAILIDENDVILSEKKLLDCVGLNSVFLSKCDNNNLVDLFLNFNRATGATMAIRDSVKVNFAYNTTILHDYILAIEALSRHSLGIITEPLSKYRLHRDQQCGIGQAIIKPWRNDIHEIQSENFDGYVLPLKLEERLKMRNRRYKWTLTLWGVPKIILHSKQYKKFYSKEWISYIKYDIHRAFGLYQHRHHS